MLAKVLGTSPASVEHGFRCCWVTAVSLTCVQHIAAKKVEP